MSWKMIELSAETMRILNSFAPGENPVAAAHALLRQMLKPGGDPYLTYRYEHSLRAAAHGLQIAQGEGWAAEPLLIACLLHDVGYPECQTAVDFSHHQDVSARIAEIFLDRIGYGARLSESICRAIQIHNLFDNVPADAAPFDLSVRDADDLDRFDCLRTYAKGGAIVGTSLICDRSAEEIIAGCEQELRRIESDSRHICGTPTAQRLWEEQRLARKSYFTSLLRQMEITREMESILDSKANRP